MPTCRRSPRQSPFTWGGRESLSPCVTTPQRGSAHMNKLSIFVKHTHADTHTQTDISRLLARAVGDAKSWERAQENQKVGTSFSHPTSWKRGRGMSFGGQEEDATTTHTCTTTTKHVHMNDLPPLPLPSLFTFVETHSATQGVCRGHAHIPHAHTARRLFCQKKPKKNKKKIWILPHQTPPRLVCRLTVSVWWRGR